MYIQTICRKNIRLATYHDIYLYFGNHMQLSHIPERKHHEIWILGK